MIIVDIETSGLDPQKHGVLSIGAVLLEDETKTFYTECQIDKTTEITDFALKVNGFSKESLFDSSKERQDMAFQNFKEWAKSLNQKLLGGENIASFDVQFLKQICKNFNIEWIFGHRYVDMHTLGFAKFGESMKADLLYRQLGLEEEPQPHNALTGALWERKAFIKLLSK